MATTPADATGRESEAPAAAALARLVAQIADSAALKRGLQIVGGGTKLGLNPPSDALRLSLVDYAGIIAYQPSELVIEARAGTRLDVIEQALAAQGQRLAFEPPRFGPAATIGGVVSAGLSGPARPYAGALRDHVLGVTLLDAQGRLQRFGGRVMKNVAGYDVSRLAAGAWGALGPIAELALRVAPQPAAEASIVWSMSDGAALRRMTELARTAWPLSGACFDGDLLRVRLAGSRPAVDAAVQALMPERIEADGTFWHQLRDLRLPFFADASPLWRLGLPPATPPLTLAGRTLIDWGGAQRWLKTDLPATAIHAAVHAVGGHAQPFFAATADAYAPLSATQRALQARIKEAFDPAGLFNAGCARVGF